LLEEPLYFFVGEAAVASDDGVCDVAAAYLGVFCDFEDDAVGEFLFVGAE